VHTDSQQCLHRELSMLRYDWSSLLASTALQCMLRATVKYRVSTVSRCNTLKQRYQIQ